VTNSDLVRHRIRAVFVARQATTLVCSAACGADLLALQVAAELKMRFQVILPFSIPRFREKSVVDRGGDWGERYDRIVEEARSAETLYVLDLPQSEDEAYREVNQAILAKAQAIGLEHGEAVGAVAVWNQDDQGADDYTAAFVREARLRRIEILPVPTL
jgi:hypothetical protein